MFAIDELGEGGPGSGVEALPQGGLDSLKATGDGVHEVVIGVITLDVHLP